MPRVTEAHRLARREQIVGAAWRCFSRDGFHNTSMANVIAEAGLSAGAVYGYFHSKEELIAATADRALSVADEVFYRMLADGATPSPAATVGALVDHVVTIVASDAGGVDLTRVAVQSWAEALRQPDIAQTAATAYRRLRDHCTEVAYRWQHAGHLPADAVPEQVGAAMLGLVQGFVLQRLLLPDTTASGYAAGVASLLSESRDVVRMGSATSSSAVR